MQSIIITVMHNPKMGEDKLLDNGIVLSFNEIRRISLSIGNGCVKKRIAQNDSIDVNKGVEKVFRFKRNLRTQTYMNNQH